MNAQKQQYSTKNTDIKWFTIENSASVFIKIPSNTAVMFSNTIVRLCFNLTENAIFYRYPP